MLFGTVYELPLSKNYVRHWGFEEAIRELIQNALDCESPFEFEFSGDKLLIHSRFSSLKPNSLLLGQTSKSEDKDAIGSFGEGYKIALLVLLREGLKVRIRNNDRDWIPFFQRNEVYDAEVLCIRDERASRKNEGLTFEVSGLSPANIEAIRKNCLLMQNNVGEVIDTKYGQILRERPGRLYVGNLYVCQTELKYGYNVKPEHLRLERDRQTVSNFDLQWLTKDMWFDSERYDEVSALIEEGEKDVEYAQHGSPELVKDACYRRFRMKHPNGIVAKNQEELEQLVDRGLTNVVIVRDTYAQVVRQSSGYRSTAGSLVAVKTPEQQLEEFFEKHRGLMRRVAIVNFKKLLTASKGWRIK